VIEHQELIDLATMMCTTPDAAGPVPCGYAQDQSSQILTITIWTYHNGKFTGY
jgi:hypothetical protein